MAVSDLVLTSGILPQQSFLVRPKVIVEDTALPEKPKKTNYGDPYLLRELSFPGKAPLMQYARGLPNPREPFAVENLEYIKALRSADQDAFASADRILAEAIQIYDPNKAEPFALRNLKYIKSIENPGNEAYNAADRMVAALVSIATHQPGLKQQPIEFLIKIDSLREKQDPSLIGTRLDQLKAEIPGSRRANGAYDEVDISEVRRLAPVLVSAAVYGFIEGHSFKNAEHDNPTEYQLSAQNLSMILKNIFDITMNH